EVRLVGGEEPGLVAPEPGGRCPQRGVLDACRCTCQHRGRGARIPGEYVDHARSRDAIHRAESSPPAAAVPPGGPVDSVPAPLLAIPLVPFPPPCMRSAPRHILCLAAVWIVAAIYLRSIAYRGWIPTDEGYLGQSAERVLGGELPHRDFDDLFTGGLSMFYA